VHARAAIKGLPGTRHPRPQHETPTASDLVERIFNRSPPNRLWVTDITEHRTREGKVYCAVVLDTFSRRVVGWSIDASQTAALTSETFATSHSHTQRSIRDRRPSGRLAQGRGAVADLPYSALAWRAAAANASMVGYSRS
jgi:transposase InsO family protein